MNAIFDRFFSAEVKSAEQPQIQADRIDLKSGPDLPTGLPDNPVTTEPSNDNPVILEPSSDVTRIPQNPVTSEPSNHRTLLKVAELNGYKTPNIIDDEILPDLPIVEQIVFRRLYRLSFGFNRQITDPVGITKLAKKCNLSDPAVKKALKSLEQRGLIVIHVDSSHSPQGGNRYSVLTGVLQNPVTSEPSNNVTGLSHIPIKDHDHDLKKTSHHQRETMTLYQSITGNQWTKKDNESYQQISSVPVDHIATTMRQVLQRAPQKPATLAYFVKEILTPTPANPGSRAAKRAQMERIIREVRDAHRHINGYLISDWSADTKKACAEKGIAFDNDLFEELSKR